jgi:hypothetical protein
MNPSRRSIVLSEADQDKEDRGNPRVPTILHELCSSEQTPPRDRVAPDVPDEGALETFVYGAGI